MTTTTQNTDTMIRYLQQGDTAVPIAGTPGPRFQVLFTDPDNGNIEIDTETDDGEQAFGRAIDREDYYGVHWNYRVIDTENFAKVLFPEGGV